MRRLRHRAELSAYSTPGSGPGGHRDAPIDDIFLVRRPPLGETGGYDAVVVYPTFTPQAYNPKGGASFYYPPHEPTSRSIHTSRPR